MFLNRLFSFEFHQLRFVLHLRCFKDLLPIIFNCTSIAYSSIIKRQNSFQTINNIL